MAIENGMKLKALMLTEDGGKSWIVVRQHYLTSLASGNFMDDTYQGKRFALINSTEKDTINDSNIHQS